MRNWIFLAVTFLSTVLNAGISEDILNSCKGSILSMSDDEILWQSDRVWIFENQAYVLNDSQQWVSLGENAILRLPQGCSTSLSEAKKEEWKQKRVCPKGHEGYYYSKKYGEIYYCLNSTCRYYYHHNFPDGAPDLVSDTN